MPYSVEEYVKETKEEFLGTLTDADIEKILKELKPEEIFKRFKPEDRLKGLTPEEIRKYLNKISH